MKKYLISLLVLMISLSATYGQSIDQNYVKTTVYKKGFQEGDLNTVQNGDKLETVQYFDGLGRPMQSVAVRQGGNDKDIITHISYDELGRQAKNYLPYTSITNNGLYRNDALSAIDSFYNTTKYENTLNPYSEQLFDGSPLNLIIETAAPGNAWQEGIQEEHTVKKEYKLIENSDEVYNFHVNYDTNDIPQLINNGLFIIGEAFQGDGFRAPTLYKFIIKNENWVSIDGNDNTTQTFKDYRGRTLLNRTFESGEAHDTYYVYDNYGNLCFVIPPKVTVVNGIDNTELNELCYQYIYDVKNRLIEKKIPGKGWEYIVYNKLNQPILTQDEIQRNKPIKEWLFVKYDAFGRVIYTGLKKTNNTREYYQTTVDSSSTLQYDTKRTTSQYLAGTLIYYNSNAIPTSFDEIYTINYYDDYNFDKDGIIVPTSTSYVNVITSSTKGLATGTKIRILATNDWITTITAYDEHNRAVWVTSKNQYLNTTDIIESKLEEDSDDIRGLVHETKTTHQKTGKLDIIIIDKFGYDHTGRLLSQKQKINSQVEEIIVENQYDDLGQLETKGVGGKITQNRLQNVDYKYNIRGWLTQINDVDNLGNDLFSFGISYNNIKDDIYGQVKPLYNGNISETYWKTAKDNYLRGYGYAFDNLNRLKDTWDIEPENPTYLSTNNRLYQYPGFYAVRFIEYDKNGNLTYLRRSGRDTNGNVIFIDRLNYSYLSNSNKLLSVSDGTDATEDGFYDGNTSGNDYEYDENGNMIKDLNKGISAISYNHLNLPTLIDFGSSNKIEYFYDASGVKLKKKVTDNGSIMTTDYAGSYVYENDVLQFFNQLEGYVEPNGSTFNYVYQYKDHLGNIRLSYTDSDGSGSINASTEIIEEHNYYPFGLKQKGYNNNVNGTHHKYMFGGKEYDESFQTLNTYDFGARNYDPALGRWMNLDPLAELMTRHSPYNYAFNNPIYFIDPDGMSPSSGEQDDFDGQPKKKKDLRREEFFNGVTYTSGSFNGNSFSFSRSSESSESSESTGSSRLSSGPGKNGKKYQQFFRSQSVELEQEVANSGFAQDNNVQASGGESADYLLVKLIFHNQYGGGVDYNIDAATLDFSSTSQRELKLTGMEVGDSRGVNLFESGINVNSLAFGKVTMTYQGDNLFSIESNKFDFDYQPKSSFGRNAGTYIGGAIFGQFFTIPITPFSIMRDVIGFGGSFMINFNGTTTIPK